MSQNNLDQRLRELPASVWGKIAQIDELKGQWTAGARLSPQVLGRLKRSVLITSTGASTRVKLHTEVYHALTATMYHSSAHGKYSLMTSQLVE